MEKNNYFLFNLGKHYAKDEVLSGEKEHEELKIEIKKCLFNYVKNNVEAYVDEIPFLYFINKNISKDGEIIFSENVRDFLFSRKILRVICEDLGELKGLLHPVDNGFIVSIDKKSSTRQMITTLSHEVGHTYFYDLNTTSPKPIFNQDDLKTDTYKKIEGLSFEIGRELILPERFFKIWIKGYSYDNPSLANFLRISDELGVSRDLIASRIYELGIWDACIFWGYIYKREIRVRDKDKYKSKLGRRFPLSFNLKKFLSINSPLIESLLEKAKGCPVDIVHRKIRYKKSLYSLELKLNATKGSGDKQENFIGILY